MERVFSLGNKINYMYNEVLNFLEFVDRLITWSTNMRRFCNID
jgi:hypothetical protein